MVSTRQMAITIGPNGNDESTGFQPMPSSSHNVGNSSSGRSPHHHPQPSTSVVVAPGSHRSSPVPMMVGGVENSYVSQCASLVPGTPNIVSPNQQLFLESLPNEILYKIFSYVEYKKIGQVRLVSVYILLN